MRCPFLSRTVVLCLDLSLHTIFVSPWSIWFLVILFGEYPCCFVYILMREESFCDTKRTCNKYYKNSKGNKFIKFRKRKGKKGVKKLVKFRKNRKGNNIYIYYMEESVLLGTKPLVDSIRHFIRDPSGVFSVCHLCECRMVQWSHDSRLLLLLNWFLHIIKRTLHVGSKICILCSRGKNNISFVRFAHSWDIVLATRT